MLMAGDTAPCRLCCSEPLATPYMHDKPSGGSCAQDLMRCDPDRARDVRVTLVEAMQLLSSFDSRLREYAARSLHQQV